MYYHLNDHIYVTQFREELILLDTKKDKYTVCFKEISTLFSKLFEQDNFCIPLQSSEYIQALLADNVIIKKDSPYPFVIDKKSISEGASNVDWRLPLENKQVPINVQVIKAFATLVKVNYYIKFRGLYATIQFLKRLRKPQDNYKIPQENELRELASIVNKASLMYPTRIKCLEWALTYVLLALQRGWKCNLEIGVQNYPFFAHAWVECDGKVVMDSQNLRQELGIILNEPFRKEKI